MKMAVFWEVCAVWIVRSLPTFQRCYLLVFLTMETASSSRLTLFYLKTEVESNFRNFVHFYISDDGEGPEEQFYLLSSTFSILASERNCT
jgi:hypothetical protein